MWTVRQIAKAVPRAQPALRPTFLSARRLATTSPEGGSGADAGKVAQGQASPAAQAKPGVVPVQNKPSAPAGPALGAQQGQQKQDQRAGSQSKQSSGGVGGKLFKLLSLAAIGGGAYYYYTTFQPTPDDLKLDEVQKFLAGYVDEAKQYLPWTSQGKASEGAKTKDGAARTSSPLVKPIGDLEKPRINLKEKTVTREDLAAEDAKQKPQEQQQQKEKESPKDKKLAAKKTDSKEKKETTAESKPTTTEASKQKETGESAASKSALDTAPAGTAATQATTTAAAQSESTAPVAETRQQQDATAAETAEGPVRESAETVSAAKTESTPATAATTTTSDKPAPGEPLTDVQAPMLMRDPTAVFEASLQKAALSGEVASEEARRRIQSLFGTFMKELVDYETNRLHDTERLRYLINKGSARSTVLLAMIERKDKEFFDKLKYIISESQKETQNLVDSAAKGTNAKLAQSYMDDLISEVEKVKQYVEVKFTEQLHLMAQQNRQELAEQYNKELLAMSFRHAATIKELTSKYSEAFGELVKKVETLQKVLDMHRNHRQYAEFAQRIALAVVEIERQLDQGVPLEQAWSVLTRLAQDDPTVSASIENVPEVVIKRGAAPLVHLQRRFMKAEKEARTAAFIPPEGSLSAQILARIFGALTAREVAMVPVPKAEQPPEYQPFKPSEPKTWYVEKTVPPAPEAVAEYQNKLAQHQTLVQSIQEQFAQQQARLKEHAAAMAEQAAKAEAAQAEAARAAAKSAEMALQALAPPQLPPAPTPPAPSVIKELMRESPEEYAERIKQEEIDYKEAYAKAVRNQKFFNELWRDHARLARAGYKLQEADLAGVLTELRQIESDRVKAVMGSFQSELEDRVALEQSIKLLRAHAQSLYVDVAEQ